MNLIEHFRTLLAEQPQEQQQASITEELERYMMSRCLQGVPKDPVIYMEFFRNWVAPELFREAGLLTGS